MEKCYRRLPLTGLINARELGGYPTENGGITKYRVFIRSEVPRNLTVSDVAFLRDYGIKTSIDFRGNKEVARQPSYLKDVDWITYLRSPTFNRQVAFGSRPPEGGPPVSAFVDWGEKYVEMAENCKIWVRETLDLLLRSDGAVIYNCTTGKDRTGMISALLLGLAGVSDDDIVADYCVSQIYLTPVYIELRKAFLKQWPLEELHLTNPFFKTDPENMSALLAHFKEKYGGVTAYITDCGLSDAVQTALRRKLTI